MNTYDAVIIGAGAGGGATAWRLTQRGWRVLLLDAGPRFVPEEYRLDQPDWERSMFPQKSSSQGQYAYARMQVLEERWRHLRSKSKLRGPTNRGTRRIAPPMGGYAHVRGIGGATLHFTGEAHRLNPEAMQMRSRFGVAADWPVSYAELESYYSIAEEVVGVAGPEDAGDRWRSKPYPLPPHPLSPASRHLADAAKSLGLRWQANARAALSRAYDGRPSCNYCGNCNRGCPRRDKGSSDLTFIAKAEATGRCEVRPKSTALRLLRGKGNTVAAVLYADATGKDHEATGRFVFVCAGAIETPRLLLLSASAAAPRGIGNGHGHVGRHLMETLFWVSIGVQQRNLESHKGLPADAICWDYNRPDAIPGVVGGCRFGSAIHEANLVGPMNYALRVVPGWGREHKQAVRDTFGHALAVSAIGESLPNEGTYVDLAPRQRDRHGRPIARIHARLDAMELRRLEFMAEKCRAILRAAGCGEPIEEVGSYDLLAMTHVFGTCRMGRDPRQSVVDAEQRVHGWSNLFVADASVFPSSGGGESPSLTVQALAIRAADRLIDSV